MNDTSTARWPVFLTGGQKIPWALDEDLRWTREALHSIARFVSLPFARVVHAAWWPPILQFHPKALRGKTVVCFADNPPAFYLTQPDFAAAAKRVDFWIARSREALEQFRTLGLESGFAPYCADPAVFHPLETGAVFRRELGIPLDAFVVGNFHRDTEGANLARPKMQKGPDVFLEIVSRLIKQVPKTIVLLAGPRRHWLVRKLQGSGIPHVFAGTPPGECDDYNRNILDRTILNRLYQILDVCVISSRWEGGPHTVLEALFAGRPVISTAVGMARDILPSECIYHSIDEAVGILATHAQQHSLLEPTKTARSAAMQKHTLKQLRGSLLSIYDRLPCKSVPIREALGCAGHVLADRFRHPVWEKVPLSVDVSGENAMPSTLIEYDFSSPRDSLTNCARLIRATQAQ